MSMNLVDVEGGLSLRQFVDGAAVVVVVVARLAGQLVQAVLEQLAGRRLGVRQTPPVHLLDTTATTSSVVGVMLCRCSQGEDEGDGEPVRGTTHRYVVVIRARTGL